MSATLEKPNYIDPEAPIRVINCEVAFNNLDIKEKNYAYYFTRASWEGQKICYFSKSYEAPALFYILNKIFTLQSVDEMRTICLQNGYTQQEWNQLTAYLAAFLQNCGNYASFGDYKFIPEVTKEKFYLFLVLSEAYRLEPKKFNHIWDSISLEIYAYQKPYGSIGLSNKGGLSSYYSSNIKEEDAKFVQEFLDSIGMSPLNTRVIKHSEDFYQVLVCSYNSGGKVYHYKEKKISITYGDFNQFMVKVVENLKECINFVSNEIQKEMIEQYIKHFTTGNIEYHKNSMRAWIKDKGPIIETNLGFIEHYLDPMKYRGEFEGIVAVVNKEQSKLLNNLVENAPKLLSNMTWPKEFERETFMKPDFTSLDVLTMATFGTPVGINLPNYDDIRTVEGFKNVNLGNCYPTPSKKTAYFIKDDILDLLMAHTQDGLFVQVSLHELLGHGSGKLLSKDKDGKFNFDIENLKNPLTGEAIKTWYESNETWNTKFGQISAGYEECRADSIALYLATFNESLEILLPGKEADYDNILFVAWYNILMNGIRGLMFYIEQASKWGQAHIAGRYAILQVCLEAGNNFVTIEETERDEKPYLYLNVDKTQIRTTGRKAIGEFIKKLQIYKSIADVEDGTKFFDKYTTVNETFLKYKSIVAQYKIPRPIELQHDVRRIDDKNFEYIKFDANPEGIIKSHIFHHQNSFEDVFGIWSEYQNYFRFDPSK